MYYEALYIILQAFELMVDRVEKSFQVYESIYWKWKKISSASAYNILNGFPTTERNKKYCYQYLVVLMV